MRRSDATISVLRAAALLASAWAVERAIVDWTTARAQVEQWDVRESIVGSTIACSAARLAIPVLVFALAPRWTSRAAHALERTDSEFWLRLSTALAGLWLVMIGLASLAWATALSIADPYRGSDGASWMLSIDGPSPWGYIAGSLRVIVGAALVFGVAGLRRAGVMYSDDATAATPPVDAPR